jgi:hypothetical protein
MYYHSFSFNDFWTGVIVSLHMRLLNNGNTRKTNKRNTLYETSLATVYSFLSDTRHTFSFLSDTRHTLLFQIPHIASKWNTLELTPIVIRVPSPHFSYLLRKLNHKFSVGIAAVVGRSSLHRMSYLDTLRPGWWQFKNNKMPSVNQFTFRLSTLYKNIHVYKKPITCRVVTFNAAYWLPYSNEYSPLAKLTVAQLRQLFRAFYWSRKFVIMFTCVSQ